MKHLTKTLLTIFCLASAFAAFGKTELVALPDTFHIVKADVVYYDDISSFRENIRDSIDNPKAYIFDGEYGAAIAIKEKNKYATFYLGEQGTTFNFEWQNINNVGNDKLIVYWSYTAGNNNARGGMSAYSSGMLIWDIDSYDCLFDFQNVDNSQMWWQEDDSIDNEFINWNGSVECYNYKVEFEEMKMIIQLTQESYDNKCFDINGEKYFYKLTESGFVLDRKEKSSAIFEKSFSDFLENFTANRESQIASLHKPFRYSGIDANSEGYSTNLEFWNEEKIEQNWRFWENKYFIDGIKVIDGQEFIGTWYQNGDTVVYEFGIPETGFVQIFIFKKINEKWYLYEFRNWAM